MPHYKFTALPEVFTSFAAPCAADPSLKITTQPDLALIARTYDSDSAGDEGKSQWARFARYVGSLNEGAGKGVSYKVLYLTRHGIGWHNVTQARVGNEEWDNTVSKLDGDGTITWSDAHLTPEGEAQADSLSRFWSTLSQDGAPLPSLYTSPLTRCLQTTNRIWSPIFAASSLPFAPLVKEHLREQMTDHTCDRRSSLSHIKSLFPGFAVEEGFTETDELWRADSWEKLRDHCDRKQRVLEEIFAGDEAQFVSLTVHSMAIAVILRVCGAEMFRVREGTSIGILVRAEEVGEAPIFDVGEKLEGY